jgi:hypothetical protein
MDRPWRKGLFKFEMGLIVNTEGMRYDEAYVEARLKLSDSVILYEGSTSLGISPTYGVTTTNKKHGLETAGRNPSVDVNSE